MRATLSEISQDNQPSATISSTLLTSLKFQSEKIYDCYFQLRDWNEYLSWHEEFKAKVLDRLEHESMRLQFEKKIDINYIKSMSSFDAYDLQEAESYSKKMKSSLEEHFEHKWDVDDLEALTFKEIYKKVLNKQTHNLTMVNHEKLMCNALAASVNMDEKSMWNNQKLAFVLLSKLSDQNENMNIPLSKNLNLDPLKHNIKFLSHIEMLAHMQQSRASENENECVSFQLDYARLARKQTNLRLASNTLIEVIRKVSADDDSATSFGDSNEFIKHFVYNDKYSSLYQANKSINEKILIGE